jgi:hypothetical protein
LRELQWQEEKTGQEMTPEIAREILADPEKYIDRHEQFIGHASSPSKGLALLIVKATDFLQGVAYQEEKSKGLVAGVQRLADDDYHTCSMTYDSCGCAETFAKELLAHYERSEAEGNRQGQEKNDGR